MCLIYSIILVLISLLKMNSKRNYCYYRMYKRISPKFLIIFDKQFGDGAGATIKKIKLRMLLNSGFLCVRIMKYIKYTNNNTSFKNFHFFFNIFIRIGKWYFWFGLVEYWNKKLWCRHICGFLVFCRIFFLKLGGGSRHTLE